jgi:hypothetical protein
MRTKHRSDPSLSRELCLLVFDKSTGHVAAGKRQICPAHRRQAAVSVHEHISNRIAKATRTLLIAARFFANCPG